MKEGIDRLKEIGAQKIHEQTHISRGHVQSILHESFEGISKIQFIGFVSILEREYGIELDELRDHGIAYFDDLASGIHKKNQVFVVAKKKKSFTALYVISVLFIFVGVAVYSINSSSSTAKIQDNKLRELDQKLKVEPKVAAEEVLVDENITLSESNSTLENIILSENNSTLEKIADEKEVAVVKSLKVLPKVKVWVGYIELDTHKKHQTMVKEFLNIDAQKDWILVFGHGNIDIEVNGEVRKFKTSNNLRFLYKDGNLTKINLTEFKRLNEGRKW